MNVLELVEREVAREPGRLRWPPPPDLRAIALTSISSTEDRNETFRAGPPRAAARG